MTRTWSRRVRRPACLIAIAVIILVLSIRLLFAATKRATTPSKNNPPLSPPLGKHQYLTNGLLLVNEDGAHPIYELMARAEKEWDEKLKRASKTLGEAVREYRRRYRRYPPKGFDAWWKYVVEHNVQLPDEYDQIYQDLEPFWGLQPSELLKRQKELESKMESYTIGIDEEGDEISVLDYAIREEKFEDLIKGSVEILDILSDVAEHLPPFRAVINPHDVPNQMSDYFVKSAALRAARNGDYLNQARLPKVTRLGWRSACPPLSQARQEPFDLDSPPARRKYKTFIYDHLRSMDPCLHPEHFYHHGQFLSHNEGPQPQPTLFPEFAYCSTMLHHNIRIPNPYSWVNDSKDADWDDKVDERLLWRGRNTGMFQSEQSRWQPSHRIFLVQHTNELNGTLPILFPTHNESERVGAPKHYRKARVNPAMMDTAFVDTPISCTPAVCEKLPKMYNWRGRQTHAEAGRYKYVIDVDGNGWSGRFKRLMTSHALIFKSTVYPEWYMDRVAPWLHYVPIKVDLSDLHDALVFFRGDGNGEGDHEDLARKIALAGRQWSKTFWRREDLAAYFFRLLLEYSRLMSLDREKMTYYPR
ncbi:glycosyltransferase family 90 protein [Amanita muscaria Koide BX008]|uniref:Glycosyltransferase family 90 protein n=1 Tax=Amanita muscaria (strain Koide BX008) TaxID=946122 RepID=A0A0C2SI15_AMAMK|nr:glycosyltransferase family 90 protein [Amanita muscaria Koide BX008]